MRNNDQNSNGKPLAIFLLIMFVYAICQFAYNKRIIDKGIYTKCIVVNSEGYKGRIMITIRYKYNGKEYTTSLTTPLGKRAIGQQYFIKLLPDIPGEVVFLKEFLVPHCLLNVEPPSEGWKELPKC